MAAQSGWGLDKNEALKDDFEQLILDPDGAIERKEFKKEQMEALPLSIKGF